MLSRVQLCDPMDSNIPGLPVLHYLPEFAQTHNHGADDATQSSHPLLPPISSCPQSFPESESFPVSQLITACGQSTGASASVLPRNRQGWFFFRMDLFDLLAVQATLKNIVQHHSLKVSILQHSDFFMVQLSHPYMTTGKTIALTIQTSHIRKTELIVLCQSRPSVCHDWTDFWFHYSGQRDCFWMWVYALCHPLRHASWPKNVTWT